MNKDNKMISEAYHNVLYETFDSSYTISYDGVNHDPPFDYSYEFDTGADQGRVRHEDDPDILRYIVQFESEIGKNGRYQFEFYNLKSEPSPFNSEEVDYLPVHDITGSGNEFKIFSTVIKIIKIFLNELKRDGVELQRIVFSSATNEPSRVKLYERLLKTLAKRNDLNYHIDKRRKVVYFILYPMSFKNEYDLSSILHV